VLAFLMVVAGPVWADEILLKSGRVLDVSIVQRSPDYIKVDAGIGVPVVYYYDEIDQINGVVIDEEYRRQADAIRLERAEAEAAGRTYQPPAGPDGETWDPEEPVSRIPRSLNDVQRGVMRGMPAGAEAVFGVVAGAVMLVFMLVTYLIFCIPMYIIAKKNEVANPWLAWVPVVQVYTMVKSGRVSGWLTLLLFIPFINFIVYVFIWVKIAEVRGKPGWVGVLVLVPIVNLLVPWYLAFSK
jgi:hypothetical protein